MLFAEKKKRYTIDDYMALPEGANFQLIENDLVLWNSPMPSSQVVHQIVSSRAFNAIFSFLEKLNDGGVLMYAPIDICFDEKHIYQPDIFYITENRKEIIKSDRIEGSPDLIVEVLSIQSAYSDLCEKKEIYEKYGVKEYVIIDPIQESADLYALENNAYQLKQKALQPNLLSSLIIQGFNFDLGKLFR